MIDYARYTFAELLDVKAHINAQKYPDNYQALCEELALREKRGERLAQAESPESDDYDYDYDDTDIVIEFSGKKEHSGRWLFLALVGLFNLVFVSFIFQQYQFPTLEHLHQYHTQVSDSHCKVKKAYDGYQDVEHSFYDLVVRVDDVSFYAMSLDYRLCQQVVTELRPGAEVSIWHDEGKIYQLQQHDHMWLSYQTMHAKFYDLATDSMRLYWFVFLAIWSVLFKSVINAIVPHTFKAKR